MPISVVTNITDSTHNKHSLIFFFSLSLSESICLFISMSSWPRLDSECVYPCICKCNWLFNSLFIFMLFLYLSAYICLLICLLLFQRFDYWLMRFYFSIWKSNESLDIDFSFTIISSLSFRIYLYIWIFVMFTSYMIYIYVRIYTVASS